MSALQSCTFVPMPDFTQHDIATGIIEGGSLSSPIVVTSVYLDGEVPSVLPKFRELVEHCANTNKRLVCGIDSNAHSALWGYEESNKRGEILEEFIFEYTLFVHNTGFEPTWRRGEFSSVIDITLSLNLGNYLRSWEVSKKPMFSDHMMIEFTLGEAKTQKVFARNYAKGNFDLFRTSVQSKLSDPPTEWSPDVIDRAVTHFNLVLNSSLDIACPKHLVKKREPLLWWNQECQNAKNKCIHIERRMNHAKKFTEKEKFELKKARHTFKKVCAYSKRESFRQLIRETSSVPAMAKLNKILDRKEGATLGLVEKEDGTTTSSTSETLEVMFSEMFPGSIPLGDNPQDLRYEDTGGPRPIDSISWVNMERVKLAISKFDPDKAPGPDGFKPRVLKELPDEALVYLVQVYTACTQIGYTPAEWCHSTVLFMPKPGKPNYKMPRSFRPLSMTSFLFKILEILALWRTETVMGEKLTDYHDRQYAFRKNRSTENALSNSINSIERHMENGEFCIAIYLDIKGAFDNVTTDAIVRAMSKKKLDYEIINWYEDYLRHRTCESTLGGSKVRVQLTRGSPQGGCASPEFGWLCPYDELLTSYDGSSIEKFGFADDTKLLAPALEFDDAFKNAQWALDNATKWAERIGVKFSPEKTSVMVFTKSNFTPNRQLSLYGTPIKWSTETNYLGITIDHKLNFNLHLERKISSCKRKLMMLHNVFANTWGPKPRITKWAYTGIVRPSLIYGSIVWAGTAQKPRIVKKLKQLQRLALVMIAHVRKSTPTAALELIYNIPPLDLFIRESALKTIARIGLSQEWVSTHSLGHQGLLWSDLPDRFKSSHSKSSHLDDCFKSLVWERNFTTVITDGKDLTHYRHWTAYTDGSKLEGNTGSGAVLLKDGTEFCCILYSLANCSVFQTEINAIASTCTVLLSQNFHGQEIDFLVDSQAALMALNNPVTRAHSVRECKSLLNQLGHNNQITLHWIEAHKGYKYNEFADWLARRGSKKFRIRGVNPLESKRSLFADLEKLTLQRWVTKWEREPGCRQSRYFLGVPSKKNTNILLHLSRDKVGLVARFLTGHAFLKRQNAIVFHGISPPPGDVSCRLCEDLLEDETPHHIITECEALCTWRAQIFGDHFLDEFPLWDTKSLYVTHKVPSGVFVLPALSQTIASLVSRG